MLRSLMGLAVVAMTGMSVAAPAIAADYAVQPRHHHRDYVVIDRGPNPYCGPRCGCPEVTFVRHRTLRQSFASSFDPRVLDEPHYSYGGMKTYARFVRPGALPEELDY